MSTPDTDPRIPVTVRATLDGWPVDLDLTIAPARLSTALARLGELGYSPRPDAPAGAVKGKVLRPRATRYSPDGTPLCPTHGTAMREGQHGHYCPRKAAAGEPANDKGYCAAVAD